MAKAASWFFGGHLLKIQLHNCLQMRFSWAQARQEDLPKDWFREWLLRRLGDGLPRFGEQLRLVARLDDNLAQMAQRFPIGGFPH